MGNVSFDSTLHPIVRVSFDGSEAGDSDVKTFLRTLDNNLDRRVPYAIVIEAPKLSSLSPQHRKGLAEWVDVRREDLEIYCLAQAYVVPGVLGRMILRSIFMLHTPVNAYKVFSKRADAIVWSRDVLVDNGVQVAPLRLDEPADTEA